MRTHWQTGVIWTGLPHDPTGSPSLARYPRLARGVLFGVAMTPTQRSLAHLRGMGYTAEVVERWLSFARRRQDLFGIIDIVCLGDGETVGVQTTSSSNVSARVKKITASEHLPALRRAGWRLLVHGWRKNSTGKWVLREVDVS